VVIPDFERSLGPALIGALEEAYQSSSCPIKALVLSNPHNPLGRYYPKEVLEQCMVFCQQHKIHLISDEVFALSGFSSPDFSDIPRFISCLSLDPSVVGCDPERVHVVWSMSKDLAASGIRLVRSFLHIG
jgi:gliotoxin/aspirochlorine biosynthesis aminotransferase